VATTVAEVEVTAIITAVNVGSAYLGFRWIDTFGRRKLAIGGYTGMIVFALVAALGLAALSGTPRPVVIMIGLDFFIALFAIGVGGTGWTLQGDVFPTAVCGQAAAIAAMVDWLANFALIEVFPLWQSTITLGGVMVCFVALALAAIAFVYRFLPEIKGLPVEEIVSLFERYGIRHQLKEERWNGPLPATTPSTTTSSPCTTGACRSSRACVSLGLWPRSTPTASTGTRSPGWCAAAAPAARSAHRLVTPREPRDDRSRELA
jgi:MFS family permease